jgi:hypothetical protein
MNKREETEARAIFNTAGELTIWQDDRDRP